jgi:hypothetical protein
MHGRRTWLGRLILLLTAITPWVATSGVNQVEMRIEQSAELVDLALPGGIEHRVDRPFCHGRTMAARLEIARNQLDRVAAACLADLVDGAAVIIGEARIESAFEGAANASTSPARAAANTRLRVS